MGIETGNTIEDLNSAWPLGTDPKSEGDNHLRLIKATLKNDVFPKADANARYLLRQPAGKNTVPAEFETPDGGALAGCIYTTAISGNDGFRVAAAGADGVLSIHDWVNGAAGNLLMQQNRSANQWNFYGAAGGGAIAAVIEATGTAANFATTAITREKGDLRYTRTSSSERFKEGAIPAELPVTDSVMPRVWIWGGDLAEDDPLRGQPGYGLVAEEVAGVFPQAVIYDDAGQVQGLDALTLCGALWGLVNDLRARLEAAGI